MNNAWVKLKLDDYNEVWDSFYDKFKFNPSIYSGNFPGILEPAPSVTYEISKDFGDGDKLADLNDKVLSALRSQTAPPEKFTFWIGSTIVIGSIHTKILKNGLFPFSRTVIIIFSRRRFSVRHFRTSLGMDILYLGRISDFILSKIETRVLGENHSTKILNI